MNGSGYLYTPQPTVISQDVGSVTVNTREADAWATQGRPLRVGKADRAAASRPDAAFLTLFSGRGPSRR